MKRMKRSRSYAGIPTLLLTALLLAGCASTGETATPAPAEEADQVSIGYGMQEASEVTGSVTRVDVEATRDQVSTVEQMLEGRVAGLLVLRTPNGGLRIQIRGKSTFMGSGEPLFVVDGMPLLPSPGGTITFLNPRDIDTIEVLKGPSTAIYGLRGAHGVIVITTKRGR